MSANQLVIKSASVVCSCDTESVECHFDVRHAIAFALLLIVATGCSTARFQQGNTFSPSKSDIASMTPETGRSIDEKATNPSQDIATIAYQQADAQSNSTNPSPADAAVELTPVPLPPPLNEAARVTLEQIEQLAIANNPAIQQAGASAHKAMGYRDQVGMKPNPIVGYNGAQLADVGTDQHSLFFEQQFVRGDKLARNRAVLNQEVQSQLWEVEVQRYRVLTDVRQRFYEALAAQRRLELADEFTTVTEKGVEVAKARQAAAEGTEPEVLQAEIQLQEVLVQRQQAEVMYQGAWKKLMAMAGTPNTPPGQLIGSLPNSSEQLSWETVEAQLLAFSPEVQAARARLDRAQANLNRQRVQAVPNITFMLGAGVDNATNNGFINTQFGLPIPIHNDNGGNISAASAEVCRASQELRRIQLAIQSRLAETGQDYEAAAVAVQQYESEIIPRAERTLNLSEQAYKVGEFSFLQTLVVRRTFFESQLEYVAAQSKLAQADALIDGLLLTGGLEGSRDTEFDSGLRDQSLSGE